MPDQISHIEWKSAGPGGRSIGKWLRKDGQPGTGLLEWTTAAPEAFLAYLTNVEERIPTGGDRAEEIHTLKIDGFFNQGPESGLFGGVSRTALAYSCSQQPTNLRDILLNIPKPSPEDRRALCRIVATQVRSLHVHFQLHHPALRTESFVFFGTAEKPDLTNTYVLDWARPALPSMYRHPEFQEGKPRWFYQVWPLMMVLSEIAEWRPLDGVFRDQVELLRMQMERKQVVTNPDWKGAPTAAVFQHGFGVLEGDRHTLEQYSPWLVKRFYDRLCELLAPSAS